MRRKEIFGEIILELAENRMWALDLKNKGRGSHTQLAPKKLSDLSLLSSSVGGEGKSRLWSAPEACWYIKDLCPRPVIEIANSREFVHVIKTLSLLFHLPDSIIAAMY